MNQKRQVAKRTAEEEGRTTRFQGDCVLDIERGPGLTINIYNHTLECLNKYGKGEDCGARVCIKAGEDRGNAN